jgi:hypothetical protein
MADTWLLVQPKDLKKWHITITDLHWILNEIPEELFHQAFYQDARGTWLRPGLHDALNKEAKTPRGWVRITKANVHAHGSSEPMWLPNAAVFKDVLAECRARRVCWDTEKEFIVGPILQTVFLHPLLAQALVLAVPTYAAADNDRERQDVVRCAVLQVRPPARVSVPRDPPPLEDAAANAHVITVPPAAPAEAEQQPAAQAEQQQPAVQAEQQQHKRQPDDDVEALRLRCQRLADFTAKMRSIEGINSEIVAAMTAEAQKKLDDDAKRLCATFIEHL